MSDTKDIVNGGCGLFKYNRPKIDAMDYDEYWRVRGGREYPPRVECITNKLEDDSSVLDIGCGDGELYEHARANLNNVDWFGIDLSTAALRKAKDKGIRCEQADVSKEKFVVEGSYDYIIVSELLEHIMNPEGLLRKLKGKYRKALIISVPNIAYYKHRIRFLFGGFPVQWQWHPSEHIRYWSVKDFGFMLKELGFDEYKIVSTNGFPYENRYRPNIHRVWPNLLAEGVLFIVPPQ